MINLVIYSADAHECLSILQKSKNNANKVNHSLLIHLHHCSFASSIQQRPAPCLLGLSHEHMVSTFISGARRKEPGHVIAEVIFSICCSHEIFPS